MKTLGTISTSIFNSSDDVWFFVSPDFEILFFNKKAADNSILLHNRELRANDSILDYAKDTRNEVDKEFVVSFKKAVAGNQVKEEKRIDYNNTSLWIQSKYIPVYEMGELIGVSLTVADITKEKLLAEEQAKANERIQKLVKQKEEFLNIAGHELRTPITTLKASLQLINRILAEDPTSPMVAQLFSRSNKSLNKLNSLIEDLLNATKLDQEPMALNKSEVEMSEVLESCCDHLRNEINHEIKLEGRLELKVHADPLRLEQVLINLLNNAIKYAPQSKTITVKVEETAKAAKISVIDKGPGIAMEHQKSLFDRYVQLDGRQGSGLGLGLYISSEIVKRHGGEIGIKSQQGEGSAFWFTLPLSKS